MKRFPEAYTIDQGTNYADALKLGTYSKAKIVRGPVSFDIINAYTQYGCGTDKVRVEYCAVNCVFKKIKEDYAGKRIGYPMIGAGLAGGDWRLISQMIDIALFEEDHTLVMLPSI
jgi:O-acetyl-ADP-ribose deacetylase (regulator of RNase III)